MSHYSHIPKKTNLGPLKLNFRILTQNLEDIGKKFNTGGC